MIHLPARIEKDAIQSLFEKNITDDMTDDAFLYQVKAYLASFGVIGHVSFRDKRPVKKGSF